MNLIDIFLVLIILLFLRLGWQNGFIAGMRDLLIWAGSLLAAFSFYDVFSSFLVQTFVSLAVWAKPLAFILLLLLTRVALTLGFGRLLRPVEDRYGEEKVNSFFGLLPGFINGVLAASVLAALLLLVPFSNRVAETAGESKSAGLMAEPLQWFNGKISPVFAEALSQPRLVREIYPKENERVTLPFKVISATTREDLELKMIALVNTERRKENLPLLSLEKTLFPVARKHSEDMFRRGYFSHYSPEGKSVADRLKAASIVYLTAGENLALAPTLPAAHTGLMKSPGHRANILHKSYRRIGIGIKDGGVRGLMVTQIFKN
ncbi:MAG: CvpA family protein [Chitinophagaceae bacterium]